MTDLFGDGALSEEREAPKTRTKRRPSMVLRLIVMLVLVVLLAAALGFGFFRHVQGLIAAAPKPVPATVSTTKAEMSAWQPHLGAVGSLSAVNGVDVATQVGGVVSAIPISSGAVVAANAVLLQLNIDPDKAQLASLQAAAELAALILKRDTQLLATQTSVSQSTVDADRADVKGKNALVAQQQAMIAEKTVVAPFDGDLGLVQVNLGQYLTPGTVIVTLQDLSQMHADFLVPQGQLNALAPGQAISVTLDGLPGKIFSGKITAINAKIDPNTRNVTVRADVPNPDKLLRPGMFVGVSVDVGAPQQHVTLPVTAITYNSYGSSVFIVKPSQDGSGKVVEQVFVTTGDRRGDQIAILKGVENGQEIVTSGQLKLKNGAAIAVDNSTQPPNDATAAPQEK